MYPLILVVLTFIGAIYLFFVTIMAFRQRGIIVGLVAINIFIFIYTYFFAPGLIEKYALSGNQVMYGNGLTMISYMFLHANPAHLIVNMLALLFFGYNLEKEFGGPQTVMIYFTSGLIAAAAHVLTMQPQIMVVGASGAIFGLMAYLTLIRPFLISPMPFLIPMPVALAAVLYTIFTMPLYLSGSISGGIAYGAHFGGLLGGAGMAFGMNRTEALKGLVVVIVITIILLMLPPLVI